MTKEYKRNEKLESIFNLVAENFESVGPHYFTYFGHQLVERSGISEGKKVLDVACGRGASLLKAAEMIGEKGQAVGTDFSIEMIKGVKHTAESNGIINLDALKMDAENLELKENSFDFVFCGLSMHFFSNPLLAVDEMYRVLNSGGKVGISTWSIKRDKTKKGAYEKAYSRVFPTPKQENAQSKAKKENTRPEPQGPDFASIEGFTSVLESAGFTNVEIQEESKAFYYESKDEWWNEQSNNATRGFFERIKSNDPELFEKFKEAAYEAIEDDVIDGRIKFEANVLYGYGVKR